PKKMHGQDGRRRPRRPHDYLRQPQHGLDRSLCTSCLLISAGRLEAEGAPAQIVMRYMASELRGHGGVRSLAEHQGRRSGSMPIMRSVSLRAGEEIATGIVR